MTQVFLSWSGERSRGIASCLKDWLTLIFSSVTPWMSDKSIGRGEQWFTAINKAIDESTVGLICLTKENKDKPWILFESGALFKGIDKEQLMTLLIDLKPDDLIGSPLFAFNHSTLEKALMLELALSINKELPEPRDVEKLTKIFNMSWLEFQENITRVLIETNGGDTDESPEVVDKQTLMLESILQGISNLDKASQP
jgi:hypothetical protein